MQDLLTLTLETLAIATALMMFADFFCGLIHLYNASATTTQEDKPEEAIAIVPTLAISKETLPLDDAWEGEGEIEVISQCCYKPEAAPVIYLLAPAQEAVEQPAIDFSDWSIRALKKEAQNRKLSKYSSLTKAQLLIALTAA